MVIDRRRIGILLAASAIVVLAGLGSASGAAGAKARAVELEWTGTTSASGEVRDLSFETVAGRKKNGRPKLPFRFKAWGMGAPLTCTGTEAPYSGYQLFPGYVGAVGDVSYPGSGRGGKLPVRKGRLSVHTSYNVSVYFIPKRITYTVTGRFTSPRSVTGTLQVSTLWSHSDGSQTNCASALLSWSACAWDTTKVQGPPCAGIDPEGPPPPDAEL